VNCGRNSAPGARDFHSGGFVRRPRRILARCGDRRPLFMSASSRARRALDATCGTPAPEREAFPACQGALAQPRGLVELIAEAPKINDKFNQALAASLDIVRRSTSAKKDLNSGARRCFHPTE